MYTLVGKQDVDFKDKETGEKVLGVKLHFTCPDSRVSGLAVDTKFFRADSVLYPVVRDLRFGPFTIVYGPRGRVEGIVQEAAPETAEAAPETAEAAPAADDAAGLQGSRRRAG